jgi:hypothetical protein
MKIMAIITLLMLAGLAVPAQSVRMDSVDFDKVRFRDFGLLIDSFPIMATGLKEDRQVLEQRLHTLRDSVNYLAGRDVAKHIYQDPYLDSLLQNLGNLNLIAKFLSERFDYRLIQIDSLLYLKSDLENKICRIGK